MILYTTNTITSKEELDKFSNVITFRRMIIPLAIIEVLLFNIYLNYKETFTLMFAIIYPIAFYLVLKLSRYFKYKKESKYLNVTSAINFYEDSIEQVNEFSSSKIPYDNILKIIETKTNYYLMLGTNTGFNIIKANCSQELLDYIENDLKKIIKH